MYNLYKILAEDACEAYPKGEGEQCDVIVRDIAHSSITCIIHG
jgi:hypothetical protein